MLEVNRSRKANAKPSGRCEADIFIPPNEDRGNEMAFKSVRECFDANANIGGRERHPSDEIVFATDQAGTVRDGRYAMRVAIHSTIAKKARLIKGDLVDILFDEPAKVGLIKRVNAGRGWKLTTGSENSRLTVKISMKPGMPSIEKATGCPCEITDEGIVFTLPDCVTFSENIRAKKDATK